MNADERIRSRLGIGIVWTILLLLSIGGRIITNRQFDNMLNKDFRQINVLNQFEHWQEDMVEGQSEDDLVKTLSAQLDDMLVEQIIGFGIIAAYLIMVICKKRTGALVFLCFTILYFSMVHYSNLFTYNSLRDAYEAHVRGYTVGGWIARVGIEFVPFAVSMFILSQGWSALRPKTLRKVREKMKNKRKKEVANDT